MPVDTDVLNTTYADLRGPVEHTLQEVTPIHDLLIKGKGSVSKGGTQIERVIMGGSVTTGTGIYTGGETLTLSRTEQTKKIQVGSHRVVIPISIPKKAMNDNDGKLGAIKLLKEYVLSAENLLPLDFERYFFSGVSHGRVLSTSALAGWNSLWGGYTSAGGVTGVTSGLLEAATPVTQSNTTQSLLSSATYGYVNQFGEVTSYAADGKRTFKRVSRECAVYNLSKEEGPSRIFLDPDSFALVEEEQDSKVRVVYLQDKQDKSRKLTVLEGALGAEEVRWSKNIILSDFTGDATEGIGFCLSPEGFEWNWVQKPTTLPFEDRIANADQVVSKIEMQGTLFLVGRRMQGVVVGCARP